MEPNKSADFKTNVADLTKIPPNEFEKYFQEWMERDDVARSLQAKLRCDLIKNFNKTNLGKHIISHTMSSTGGSTMRLTLSPLVLALNTLVAEFLYAQNCHFTLSVFCTEIPFRNTLPDFEGMRRFRFNIEEISEIWQAVTGSKSNKRDLNKNIIQTYEANPNMSLLLLIIKNLLKRDPLEQLKRNAEVQTEIQEKLHKSILAQVSDSERKSPSKAEAKDDNLQHINQYLLTLSEKVMEMTREFEQFAKQRHESRSRTLKSSRSREYYTFNKSLERITENMKAMAQAKRKNKRLSSIVASIDNLTQQFGKCAEHFDNVTKVFSSRGDKPMLDQTKSVKVRFKEKQTETEVHVKSYAEWIQEMRNTENGQKFLNRVEISLHKALTKHREQLQSEMDIKMRHLKSLMRLHYQQKLSKHLLRDPKISLEETRKCNDNIEKKLQQFEKKQMELLQKLKESSTELREAQQQQQNKGGSIRKEEKLHENFQRKADFETKTKSDVRLFKQTEPQKYMEATKADVETSTEIYIKSFELLEPQKSDGEGKTSKTIQLVKDPVTIVKPDYEMNANIPILLLRDVSKAQKEIVDVTKTIAEQGRSVDHIIYDAKLRIQQLENESNQLEQNFQSYLERRKRDQEQDAERKNTCTKYKENITTKSSIKKIGQTSQITGVKLLKERTKPLTLEEQDEEIDEEFQRMKETLQKTQEQNDIPTKSAKSDSSTSSLEIRNAILEAKLKFFDHENTLRKYRAQGEEIRSANLLQDYFNHNFGQFTSETNKNLCEAVSDDKNNRDLNLESSLSEINIKDKTLDEEHDIELSPMTDNKSQKLENKTPTSVRRELFSNQYDRNTLETAALVTDLKSNLRYHEPIPMHTKDLGHALKDFPNFAENIKQKSQTATTSLLIKQSMTKMQQLFKQQSKSKETLREMVNEIVQERDLNKEDIHNTTKHFLYIRPNEALDKSLSTTVTSTTTTTTNTNQTSDEFHTKNHAKVLESVKNLNRISNTSMPTMFNLSSESEESYDSGQLEVEMTQETIKDMEEVQETKRKPQMEEVGQLSDSSETSELRSLHSPTKKYHESEPILQQEFGQINDTLKTSDLNLYSPGNDKEIGELYTESNRTFAPIEVKLSEGSSTRSSSDLEISTGDQNKNAKNVNDDSESDFWA